jgi:hypothetical protein
VADQNVDIQVRAKNLTEEAFKKVSEALKLMEEQAGKTSEAGSGLFATLAGGVATGELVAGALEKVGGAVMEVGKSAIEWLPKLVEQTAKSGVEMLTLSDKVGIAVEGIGRLKYIALQSNTSLDTLTNGVFKMEASLGKGSATVTDAIGKLGLSVAGLRKEAPDQALFDIMSAMAKIPNASDRAAAGVAIFSKSWKDLAPISQKDLPTLIAKYNELGGMTTETALASEHFEQAMNDVHRVIGKVGGQIGSALMPAVATAADLLAKNLTDAFKSSGLSAQGWQHTMEDAASGLGDALKLLLPLTGEVVKGILSGFDMLVREMAGKTSAVVQLMLEPYVGLRETIPGIGSVLDGAAVKLARFGLANRAMADGVHSGVEAAKTGIDTLMAAGVKTIDGFGTAYHAMQAKLAEEADKRRAAAGGGGGMFGEETEEAKAQAKALEDLAHAHDLLDVSTQLRIQDLHDEGIGEGEIAKALGLHESTVRSVVAGEKAAATEQKELGTIAALVAEQGAKDAERQLKLIDQLGDHWGENQKRINALSLESLTTRRASTLSWAAQENLAIDDWEAQQKAGIDKTAANWKELYALIESLAKHRHDVVNQTEDTIIERMKAAGVETQRMLQDTASRAVTDYRQMRDSGLYTASQVQQAYEKSLDAIGNAYGEQAVVWQRVGLKIRDTVKDLGASVSENLSKMLDGGESLRDGFGKIWDAIKAAAINTFESISEAFINGLLKRMVTGLVSALAGGAATSAWGTLASTGGAVASRSLLGSLVAPSVGAGAGAAGTAGAAGSISLAPFAGPAAGVVAGLLAGYYSKSSAVGAGVGAGTGAAVGSITGPVGAGVGALVGAGAGLIGAYLAKRKERKADQAADTALSDLEAQLLQQYGSLEKIKTAAGNAGDALVAAWNSRKQEGLAHFNDLLQVFKAELTKQQDIQKGLGAIGAGQLISPDLLKQIGGGSFLNPDSKAALGQFLTAQTSQAAGGLNTIIQSGALGSLGGGATGGLGAAAAAVWGQMSAQGASLTDIVAAIGPSVTTLQKQFQDTGTTGGAAFDKIAKLASFASDAGVAPLITAAGGLNSLMAGLANTGLMDQDTFAGLANSALDLRNHMTEAGKDGDAALQAMQPTLQTLWQLQDQYGFKVDDNTQAMLDQAQASGLVGEKFKPASDKMIDAIQALIDKFDIFLGRIKTDLPDAAADVKVPDIEIPYHYRKTGGDGDSGIFEGTDLAPQHASGALITRTHIANVHAGEIIGPQGFITQALSAAMAANGGSNGGAPTAIYLDGKLIARVVAKRMPGALQEMGVRLP